MLFEIKSSLVNEDALAFMNSVKNAGMTVAINGFNVDMAGLTYATTLCGAAKRTVGETTGTIQTVLPSYRVNEETDMMWCLALKFATNSCGVSQ